MIRTASVSRERRIIFIKSWNEWAEGNHLEPDLKFGHAYPEAVRNEVMGRQHEPLALQQSMPPELPAGELAVDPRRFSEKTSAR
jgi:hypothetical protein